MDSTCQVTESATARLVILGSELNQSLGIATGEEANCHHGILDDLNTGGILTLIKPNEDFVAWHDGYSKKPSGEFIWKWHLNCEGLYSLVYPVESLASTKWMQNCFSENLIAGFRQSGAAAIVNALRSKLGRAILVSGSSVINDLPERLGHSHLIGVPGYETLSYSDHLVNRLKQSPTQCFLVGESKKSVLTRLNLMIESYEQRTANFLRGITNVIIAIHDGGYGCPVESIQPFFANIRFSNSYISVAT